MDIIGTIFVIWLAYRGYQWYQRMQAQVGPGPKPDEKIDITQEEHDDYVDYEEVK